MPTKSFRRGDFVKYDGSLKRYKGTWWTVSDVACDRNGRVISYTLQNIGIGRLRNVSPQHVNQDREDVPC